MTEGGSHLTSSCCYARICTLAVPCYYSSLLLPLLPLLRVSAPASVLLLQSESCSITAVSKYSSVTQSSAAR